MLLITADIKAVGVREEPIDDSLSGGQAEELALATDGAPGRADLGRMLVRKLISNAFHKDFFHELNVEVIRFVDGG